MNRKKIKFLINIFAIAILFLFQSSNTYAAVDINYSIQAGAATSGQVTEGSIRPEEAITEHVRDDDTETAYGGANGCAGVGDSCSFGYFVEVDFGQIAQTINKAEIHHNPGGGAGGPFAKFTGKWYVDLYYNSTWHQVMSGSWEQSNNIQTDSKIGVWNNVAKIRLRADGGAFSGELGYPAISGHATFELRAWGPLCKDIGLRIKKLGETTKIGVQDLKSSHKLRVRKGSTTYGIPLVATDDSNASPVRIYDGSEAKALPKVE